MNRSAAEIEKMISTFRKPDPSDYPEHEHNIDPFDVQICLDQIEWGKWNQPRKTLFVLTGAKITPG
jgi:hypothetical protein